MSTFRENIPMTSVEKLYGEDPRMNVRTTQKPEKTALLAILMMQAWMSVGSVTASLTILPKMRK